MGLDKTFAPYGLKISQPKSGYRFSQDTLVLAHHINLKDSDLAIDLGTGCGVIPLILASRNKTAQFYGVEVNEELAGLAAENVAANGLGHRIKIVHADMKQWVASCELEMADVVCCNPPYGKFLSGRINPNEQKAVARHEILITLSAVVSVAERLLKPLGSLVMVYPAKRLADLITTMRGCRLEPKRLRFVHARYGAAAGCVVAEGVKHAGLGIEVDPPLILCNADGTCTPEVVKIIGRQSGENEILVSGF